MDLEATGRLLENFKSDRMQKYALLFIAVSIAQSLFAQVDKLYSEMTGTCTFGNVTAVDSDTYTFDIFVTDQGSEYSASDVAVGHVIIDGNKNKYIVTAINVQSVFLTNITVDCIGGNCPAPFGKGQITQATPNFNFDLFTPDNQNGLSQIIKASLETSNWLKLDQILNELTAATIYGYFLNHVDAGADGVPVGSPYKAALGNTMGMPWGALIIRTH